MKKYVILSIIITALILILLINPTSALGKRHFCLDKYETIYFSECNPAMDDYRCTQETCQLCVNEIKTDVYCPSNACNTACEDYDEPIPEEDLPEVRLRDPDNDTTIDSGEVEFKYRVINAINADNCSLILNDINVFTTETRIQSSNTIYYTPVNGSYNWRIDCTVVDSDRVIESETWHLTYGTLPDIIITLTSPADNSILESTTVQFEYGFSEPTDNCNLLINDNISSEDIPTDSSNIISKTLEKSSWSSTKIIIILPKIFIERI